MAAIPFTDVAAMTRDVWPTIEHDYLECLLSGGYIGGSPVASFETAWARYCGVEHAVGVANGTSALQLTLTALGIGPGDEVIVPANTFIATVAAVIHAGATPRFADVGDDTLLLTPLTLKAAITDRTRAVIVVHLYGQMPDMDGLLSLANDEGLLLIEDAAQAHGAEWADRRAGSLGIAACFSFYPAKNLGAFGDAGAVVTPRPEVADRVRALANHGRAHGSAHYEHQFVGANSRLDALQAIVLSGKLAFLEEWTNRRIALAARYRAQLRDLGICQIGVDPLARHVYHLFAVRVANRELIQAGLEHRGIQTGVHYPVPCHLQPPLRRYAHGPLPTAERAADELLSLPLFPSMADSQVDAVCDALGDVLHRQPARTKGTSDRVKPAESGEQPQTPPRGDVLTDVARQARDSARVGRPQEAAKRALDLVAGLMAVIVSGPLLLLLCGLVRWTSPGPALFRQERLCRDKRHFTMLKLRTMRVDNDDQIHREFVAGLLRDDQPAGGARSGLYKLDNDPRVTRLGSWLRRTSLDELPQLLNVLKGDMSLVGPRPSLPWEAEIYPEEYQPRFEVKPGMTGLWQIRGRSRLSAREGLELDVEYVRTRSFAGDLRILIGTLPALFRGGAR
jgi:dTDP-4-amino-4,6-dideoxygalactose transaminase/lipopolysaccharide/colanic/teichoic acid biosynthesis glycosyltransferase